jgi:hypothetical protein
MQEQDHMIAHFQAAIDAYDAHRSYAAASQALGISEGAYRSRLWRGRKANLKPTPKTVKPRISVSMGSRPAKPVVPAKPANSCILLVSDLHCPYQHKDALAFLQALKAKYNPDRVVCVGDELDYHDLSFHDSDPDLDSAGRELQKGREVLWELAAIFPDMDLVDSNHGSMAYRKGKANGIPRHLLLEYKDAIFGEKLKDGTVIRPNGRGDGWNWHGSLDITLPSGQNLHVVHGLSKNTIANVKQLGCCFAQGHYHGSLEVVYNGTPRDLNWGVTTGCLVDPDNLAFAYGKNFSSRPVLGCAIVIDGQPRLLPMVLQKGGRWSGYVP